MGFFERIFNKEQYSLIKKDISPTELNKLKFVGDPAIKLHESNKRVYPQHNIFSNLIGLKTNELISKIEKNMNKELAEGKNLKLTVDLRIQNIVREELYESLIEYKAKAALAVVMNVKSGEIFSMIVLRRVDFPIPFDPITAILEFFSTLKQMFLHNNFSLYPIARLSASNST